MGLAGELVAFEAIEGELVWHVATAIKRMLGIPRGEQRLYIHDEHLGLLSPLPLCDELVLTLVRTPVACEACGHRQRRRGRKKRVCSACWDARYCDEICQRLHWDSHRAVCGGAHGGV